MSRITITYATDEDTGFRFRMITHQEEGSVFKVTTSLISHRMVVAPDGTIYFIRNEDSPFVPDGCRILEADQHNQFAAV